MSRFWIALGALGVLSGAAFLVLWLLGWVGWVPPGEPLAVSGGVVLLVTGAFRLRAAADRGTWARSSVGRLTAFAEGTFFCAVAAALLGRQWLPGPHGLGWAAVAVASMALVWFGKTRDGRRAQAEGAPGKPAEPGAEPGASADRAGTTAFQGQSLPGRPGG